MRAVPGRVDSVIQRLERARHARPGAREAERLLRLARSIAPPDAERLIRFHEAILFLRAYPHSRRVRELAERLLRSVARRVAALERAGEDLSPFDAPEVAGIAGTTVGTDFSFDVARFLAKRFPRNVRIDWDAGAEEDRMRATWPALLPLLEEEALADANVPYLDWLAAAAGRRRDDPAWLLGRYARLPGPRDSGAERFESLEVPIAWGLSDSRASRTRMRLPGPAPFFHDAPFLARRDVSLDAALSGPPLALRRLPRREGAKLCDLMREATAARYREFYTFTYADPTSVVSARPGRGVELFLVGVEPERRLPLRSAYGGFVVKNGVPIGYIEGLALAERLEIGFNMYYTFREGESAWIYAQVLKMHRDALGVTSFSIDPYQLGFENDEALESGAFWFYRKLGFKPTSAAVRELLDREEQRIAIDPDYRSSRRTLERLVTRNLIYDAPGTPQGDWNRFHVRNVGLGVNRRMRRSGETAARFREKAEMHVARALGLSPRSFSPLERRFFSDLALVLDGVQGIGRWSASDRRAVGELVRAKAGRGERRYLRLLRGHGHLRRALLRLGSVTADR
jgi:hypothetical protein